MPYGPAMYGLEPIPDPPPSCGCCGGTKFLRGPSLWHSTPICKPCFFVWYDPPEVVDQTDPVQIGRLSLRMKAAGKYPWTGEYAPATGPLRETGEG